ncbi:MAG: hypothetical protein WCV56_03975 [Candidatus Omnitrophota bacterium]
MAGIERVNNYTDRMVEGMAGSIAAVVMVFLAAMIIHCVYSFIIGNRLAFASGVRKLAYHGALSLKIWAILLPAVIFSESWFTGSGEFNSFVGTFMSERAVLVFYGTVLFFSFFFVYLTFYYILDRSVSSRMMMEIERSPERKLSLEELKAFYGAEEKYTQNLEGMLDGGFIKNGPSGRFLCTPKGAFVAGISHFFKNVLRLGPGG